MGGIHFLQDSLAEWLIVPVLFERRVNLTASNDNAPEDCPSEDEIPGVSLLSFY